MKITKKKKIILLSIIGSLIILLSISYAFFKPIIDQEKSTRVDVVAKTLDQFMFIQGDSMDIEINHLNFLEGMPNITGATTTTAKLIANNKTNEAAKTYYVYFYIGKNEFEYSTDEEEPEIILTLKDPSGNNITYLDNLMYVTKPDVSGFDITNSKGVITIAEEYEIETTSSTEGTSQEWEAIVTIRNLDIKQNSLAGKELNAQFVLSSEEKIFITFEDIILANNYGLNYIMSKTPPDFSLTAYFNEGMFVMEDDYGDSYYFRGAVDNNWVYFAGFYWRIVRINGDGSVKLIYSGTIAPQDESESVILLENFDAYWDCQDYCRYEEELEWDDPEFDNCFNNCFLPRTSIGESVYNILSEGEEYLGYMYELGEAHGFEEDSTIKSFVDAWYEDNLIDYEEYLSDFIVCNDREFMERGWNPYGRPDPDEHFSTAYYRFFHFIPKLECSNIADAFTVNDDQKGNAALTYPIGLLTLDEVILTGITEKVQQPVNREYNFNVRPTLLNLNPNDDEYSYLKTGTAYWLISPYGHDSASSASNIFMYYVSGDEIAYNIHLYYKIDVRPVISLSPNVSISGTGHWDDPYEVILK